MPRFKSVDGEIIQLTAEEEAALDAEETQNAIDEANFQKTTGFKQERFAQLPPQYEVIPALIEAIKTMQDGGTVFPAEVAALVDSWEAAKLAVADPNKL